MSTRHPVLRAIAMFDDRVDARVQSYRGHPTLDRVMYAASELGDWALIWHIVGVASALRPRRQAREAVRLSAILGLESVFVNGGVKSLFRRARPPWEHERPYRLRRPRTTSFPSGHASSAFTAAGVLSRDDPMWPLYYGIAALVATSRVYVKLHHASDVLAGAALGAVLARVAVSSWPADEPAGGGRGRT